MNHVYKILSGALAERLKPILPNIIHGDQKGFVSGRYIGECIRNTYDVIEYAKNNNRSGLILCIDFEKAFDSIYYKNFAFLWVWSLFYKMDKCSFE